MCPRILLAALLTGFLVGAGLPGATATDLHTFYGDVVAVDLAAKRITLSSNRRTFVFHVTPETKLTTRRGPIRLENVQRGQGAAVVMRLGPGGIGLAVQIHFDLGRSSAFIQSLYGVKTTGGEIITGMAVNNFVVSKPPDEAWSTGITYESLRPSMFVLTIQSDGTVADAKPVQGTGYRELDERAVRWFKKWRFRPNSVVEARMPFGYYQHRR